jgi:hypothetical protein
MAGFTSVYSTVKLVDPQKKLEPGQLTTDEHESTQINHKTQIRLKAKRSLLLSILSVFICTYLGFSKAFFCRSG